MLLSLFLSNLAFARHSRADQIFPPLSLSQTNKSNKHCTKNPFPTHISLISPKFNETFSSSEYIIVLYLAITMHKSWDCTFLKAHPFQRNRQSLVFPTMSPSQASLSSASSASNNSELQIPEPEEDLIEHVDRHLPNGDLYTGDWKSGRPHGIGKYLWTDGCMYEGEWKRGRATGRGKFSWPCGATYEGGFDSGYMNGFGIYTSSSRDTYWGDWSMNLKHGHGKKSFSNGDYYDGEWQHGFQHGHGKYVWKNGNEYVGNWMAAAMHGRGILVWANGNKYDGVWKDGLPNGSGTFRWPDGSLYIGCWSMEDGRLEQKGAYYASTTLSSLTARDPEDAFKSGLEDCIVCPGEVVSVLPSQKKLHWMKEHSMSTISFASLRNEAEGEVDWREGERASVAPLMRWPPMEIKKQGETISKEHKNYELMLNLQLGIRYVYVMSSCLISSIRIMGS